MPDAEASPLPTRACDGPPGGTLRKVDPARGPRLSVGEEIPAKILQRQATGRSGGRAASVLRRTERTRSPVLQVDQHLAHASELHLPPQDVGLAPLADGVDLLRDAHDVLEDVLGPAHGLDLLPDRGQFRVGHLDLRPEHAAHLFKNEFRLFLLP